MTKGLMGNFGNTMIIYQSYVSSPSICVLASIYIQVITCFISLFYCCNVPQLFQIMIESGNMLGNQLNKIRIAYPALMIGIVILI